MTSERSLQSAVQDLERRRDELKLKMHLAKADAKAEWDNAERKWEQIRTELKRAEQGGGEAMADVRDGAKKLVNEVTGAYERIRDQIAD